MQYHMVHSSSDNEGVSALFQNLQPPAQHANQLNLVLCKMKPTTTYSSEFSQWCSNIILAHLTAGIKKIAWSTTDGSLAFASATLSRPSSFNTDGSVWRAVWAPHHEDPGWNVARVTLWHQANCDTGVTELKYDSRTIWLSCHAAPHI